MAVQVGTGTYYRGRVFGSFLSGCPWLSLAGCPWLSGLADPAPFKPQDPAIVSPSFQSVRVHIQ